MKIMNASMGSFPFLQCKNEYYDEKFDTKQNK